MRAGREISLKLFKTDKSNMKTPKKQPLNVRKLKIFNFKAQLIGRKGFANKF